MSDQYMPSEGPNWINLTTFEDAGRGFEVEMDTNTGELRHRVVFRQLTADDPQMVGEWVDGAPPGAHVEDSSRRKPTYERPSKVVFMD